MKIESLISFLKGEEKFYTGLMVEETYACAAKLKGSRKEQKLLNISCVSYDGVFRNGELVDTVMLVEKVASLPLSGEVACGIPSPKVFYMVIEVDKEKNPLPDVTEKVKETFGEDAFDKVVVEWEVIPYERVEGKKDVAVFVIKREEFEEQVNLYKNTLGLNVAVLEPEFTAIGRVVNACYPDKDRYIVMQVEENRTSVYSFVGENPYFVKNYPHGISSIVKKMSEDYGITKEKARKILKGEDEPSGGEYDTVKGFFMFILQDAFLLIEEMPVIDESTKPNWLFFVGKGFEGTRLFDIAKEGVVWEGFVEGATVVNPFLIFSENEVMVGKPSQAVAVGLAMRYEGDEEEK